MEKRLAAGIVVLVLFSLVGGYAAAQVLIQRTMTASVRIKAEGDLAFFNAEGIQITAIDFGELSVLEKVNTTIFVRNAGNTQLSVTFARTDGNSVLIAIRYLNPDGTQWNPSTPRILQPGAETPLVFEVWGKAGAVGEYSLEFTFMGEG